MISKKIGVAVIGTGMAAKPHALALNDIKEKIDVIGVYSRNKNNREKFAKNYNFETFSDISAIKNNTNVDMVILITPPNQRLELVNELSSAGKHVLMEKPIERTSKNAQKIVSICENNNVNLPGGNFITYLSRSRLTYSFNPKMYIQALLQYNNQSNESFINWRFIIQRSAASGLYVVYNQMEDYDGIPTKRNNTLILKYSHLFDF